MEAWVHSCVVRGNLLIYPASCGPHFEPVLAGSCDGIASVRFPFNVCQFCHDHRDEQSIYAPTRSGDQDSCFCIESGKRCRHERSGEKYHDNSSTDISSTTLRLQTFRLQTFRLL